MQWLGKGSAPVTVRELRLQQNLRSHFQNIIKASSRTTGKFLGLIFVAEFSIKQSLRKLRSARLNKQEAKVNFTMEFQPQLNALFHFTKNACKSLSPPSTPQQTRVGQLSRILIVLQSKGGGWFTINYYRKDSAFLSLEVPSPTSPPARFAMPAARGRTSLNARDW